MKVIGQTIDDAAGEAFDKTAKMLGLPYPGGPLVDQYARLGNPERFAFTIPKIPGLNYSFSGLKTQILYFLNDAKKQNPAFVDENLHDICASIQQVIVAFLMQKLRRAVQETGITHVALAGGVSANSALRNALQLHGNEQGWSTYIPAFEYCTDNAAMIAIAGYQQYLASDFAPLTVSAQARMLRD
jgi:N6-L-threonylcarbamoyladenine synthase